MKKYYFLMFILFSNFSNAYYWADAVPDAVVLVDGGLVVGGLFNTAASTCATGVGIFLKNNGADDKQFDRKLSIALMALASGKKLRVLIFDPASNCKLVSSHKDLPVAHDNYWMIL